jgi:serine/threonine-protein kinase
VGAAVETGRVLAGRYRLEERLGRGGMGEVWRASDAVLEREVAVKTLALSPADEEIVKRFAREARALARLNHPNVVPVYDSGADDGASFMVMQLLSGPSLAALLAERGPLPLEEAIAYARQAAAGLAAAHRAGLVHRDVSPANLILDAAGALKLVDFGVARLTDGSPTLTMTGTVFATPGYVSPEQAAGRPADARSDLYALGCVLYALLAGEPPFKAEHPLGVVHQHLTSPPPPLGERRADVPAELDLLLGALLAKDPRDRPASAEEVEQRLAAIGSVDGEGAGAATVPLPTAETRRLARPARRRRAVWAIGLVAAAGLLALGALLATTLGGGGTHAAAPPSSTRHVSTTSTTTTAPRTTTSTTTHAATTTAPPPASVRLQTPAQALAAAQAALAAAQSAGRLDTKDATDLQHRLDDVAKALQHPNPADAAHKVDDLLKQLNALESHGQITPAAASQVSAPITRLAALLPSEQAPAPPGPPGHDKKDKQHGH